MYNSSVNPDNDGGGDKARIRTVVFLAVVVLAVVGDGFDIAAISYIIPELAKAWHIHPSQLAPVLTSGLTGMAIGASLFGYFGDRIGRKRAVLVALVMFGVLTLIRATSSSLPIFSVLRFFTGVGLGGLLPNILALTSEVAPRRLRGTFAIIALFGVPIGLTMSGWVAAFAVPAYGWQVLLLIGGTLPLVVAVLVGLLVPESQEFLVRYNRDDRWPEPISEKIRAEVAGARYAGFGGLSRPGTGTRRSRPGLFDGSLIVITPALWVVFAANQFTNFFVVSWLPTLLQADGLTTAQAGIVASLYPMGGLAGGILLALIVDRFGLLPIVILFLVGCSLVGLIGMPGLSLTLLGAIIGATGLCVAGNNFAANSAVVMIYPTSIRSLGAGCAQAIGRLGSVAAPVIGGLLLRYGVPLRTLYYVPAVSLLVGGVASIILTKSCYRRFQGYRFSTSSEPPVKSVTSETPANTVIEVDVGLPRMDGAAENFKRTV